jgi:tetratricopeptide (TPR) repeat protein
LRGWLYFEDQNTEAALGDFTQAITLDAKNAEAYRKRSLVYSSLSMAQESRLDREKANALSPYQIASFEAYDLELQRIWQTTKADDTAPDKDIFLVMEVSLYNYAPDKLCLDKDGFRLQAGDKKYTPSKMYQVSRAYYPNKLYPPSEGKTCLSATRKWDTFLAYDLPKDVEQLLMQLEIQDFRNNFRLQLSPTTTDDYGFYITELDGQSNMSIGTVRLDTREEIETVLDSKIITI